MNAKIPTLLALSATLVFAQERKPLETEAIVEQADLPASADLPSADPAAASASPDWTKPDWVIPSINIQEKNVEFLFQTIEGDAPGGFNFIFNNGAEKLTVPKLKLRNVTFDALIEVLQVTLGISVEEISSGEGTIYVLTGPAMRGGFEGMGGFEGGGGMNGGSGFETPALPRPPEPPRAPDAPEFLPKPALQEGPPTGYNQPTSSRATPAESSTNPQWLIERGVGIGRMRSRRDNENMRPSPSHLGGNSNSLRTFTVPGPESPQTEVFGISELGLENDDIVNAIKEVWDLSEPGWQEGETPAKLLIHPETKLLVVKASRERIEEVSSILQTVQGMHTMAQSGEMAEMKQEQEKLLLEFEVKFDQMERMHEMELKRLQSEIERLSSEEIKEAEVELEKNDLPPKGR